MSWLLFIGGVIVGFLARYLWEIKTERNLHFNWLQYLLMAVWVVWVGFGIIFVGLSIGEYEIRAASLGGMIFGVVAVLGLIGLRILYLRQNEVPAPASKAMGQSKDTRLNQAGQ